MLSGYAIELLVYDMGIGVRSEEPKTALAKAKLGLFAEYLEINFRLLTYPVSMKFFVVRVAFLPRFRRSRIEFSQISAQKPK